MLGEGFKIPLPKEFDHIKALQHFTGQDKKGQDLRFYNEYYTYSAMQWLLHSPVKNKKRPLRIFLQPRDDLSINESFYRQLGNFNVLRNSLDRPGLFVTREPGATENQYILGILYKNSLLIINPNGKSSYPGFYKVLQDLHSETKLKIYIDEQSFHHEKGATHVSSGPICIELAWHFYQQKLKELFKIIKKAATPQKNGKFEYHGVSLKEYLPPDLQDVQDQEDFNLYKNLVWNIRIKHYFHLLTICRYLNNAKEANQYFEECTNAPEQQLLERLMLNELSALEFDDDPLYLGLREGACSPLAIKLKAISKSFEQKDKVLEASVQEKKDEVANLKKLRNFMLLTLIVIPLAHFLLWPYLGSILSVAAFEFLTASTTPWLLAALSVLLFTSTIVAVAAYDSYYEKPALQMVPDKNRDQEEIDLEAHPEAMRFASPSYSLSLGATAGELDPSPSKKSSRASFNPS